MDQSIKGKNKHSAFRTVIGMMINPAETLKSTGHKKGLPFALMISGLAFGLFFAQTGLDLYKTGQKDILFVAMSAGVGLVYGILIIPILGLLAWVVLKVFKSSKDLRWSISSFCLSYSGALIYGIIGILFSLGLGWRTALAFGITGVLWAVGPLMACVREMTDGNNKISILIASLYSVAILISWSYLSNL